MSDVVSCLASNSYDETKEASATRNSIAMNACNSLITTCMSVNGVTGENKIEVINKAAWVSFLMSDEDESAEKMAKFNSCISTGGSYTFQSDGTGSCTCANTGRTELNNKTGECECPSGSTWDGDSCETATS